MQELKHISLFDYKVFSDELSKVIVTHNQLIINTINAYSYVVAKKDPEFQRALQNSDILLPDGFPIVLAARLLQGTLIKKIAGADIFRHLCQHLRETKGSCVFLGSTQNTLLAIEERLKKEYPAVKPAFFSPPYKAVFSENDNTTMVSEVNKYEPDVLFVGMTAPKQEKWVADNKEKIKARIICSIGAVFDFYAGSVTRPSEFWINNNLEWFIRLLKEPKRLWKRYLIYSPLFFKDLLLKVLFRRRR